jgi:hypothetical protein
MSTSAPAPRRPISRGVFNIFGICAVTRPFEVSGGMTP